MKKQEGGREGRGGEGGREGGSGWREGWREEGGEEEREGETLAIFNGTDNLTKVSFQDCTCPG